ncbi:hypothetical protein PHLCEN_2v13366 [Hermanssonia centrifuga]|uniref:Asparagine--tRNA ligase, mitochondrial n=1 Tax=Hermanssonia centrifuga TaxID=98765 RepID=A0A2R6NEH6_9APHY|nr:hypothetical protein PHLCEN_2v13366 [Hermanssonia centrifuga]
MIFRRFLSSSTLPPSIRQLLSTHTPSDPTAPVRVNGWVRSVRRQKRVAFAHITDGSSHQGLQAVFTNVDLAKGLTNGASVSLSGTLLESPGAGQDKELVVQAVDVIGECEPLEYPIQKQTLTTEYLRDHCHLRARTSSVAAMLRLRDNTMRTLHEYFQAQDFCYTNTPILTSNDCEGAGETFHVSHPDQTASTSSNAVTTSPREFFGRPAYLTVSSQLHLEALATSLARVYTISPCFRAERSQTSRHLSEFWMLEAEWAFTHVVDDVCQFVEGMVKHALRQDSNDLSVLSRDIGEHRQRSLEKAKGGDTWMRLTYTDAISELEKAQATTRQFEFTPSWGKALRSEHERWIAEHLADGPVFVTDYPASLKPFYMRLNSDGKTVACFDLLVPHLGELVGGSLREERLGLLEEALEKQQLSKADYGWYLDIRKYGGAPHGGFGLGFERLVSWMSGIDNVRECIPMPRWAGRMLL